MLAIEVKKHRFRGSAHGLPRHTQRAQTMTQTMTSFPIHTLDTAPQASKPALERLRASVGMIPNLAGAMADSPALIQGFVAIREAFQGGSFTAVEREALSLANAAENACRYCTAIHATFAAKAGLDPAEVERLRTKSAPKDARLAALTALARALIAGRGNVAPDVLERFLAAGFSRAQVLEVVLSVGLSTIANYAGHLTHAAPDEAIRAQYR
jgi:uncharacterized peroxidase-related enzyme